MLPSVSTIVNKWKFWGCLGYVIEILMVVLGKHFKTRIYIVAGTQFKQIWFMKMAYNGVVALSTSIVHRYFKMDNLLCRIIFNTLLFMYKILVFTVSMACPYRITTVSVHHRMGRTWLKQLWKTFMLFWNIQFVINFFENEQKVVLFWDFR